VTSPELQKFLSGFPECMMDADDSLETVRAKMHAIHPRDHDADTFVETLTLAGLECAWVSTPATDPSRAVFFVHGGAFVSTGLTEYHRYAGSVAHFCRARVLVFAYTLAPELRYPGQLEETLGVWQASGLEPARTALMGDSCGGGIALAALCRLRDAGRPLPACYAGLTPWLDARQAGDAARHPRGVDPFVNAAWIRARFRDYAGDADLDDPYLSPLGVDLGGLPPLYLGVGTIDTTSDDSTRLAARAARAGVEVQLDVVGDHIHGLHGLAGMCPESTAAMQRVGDFVIRAIP
jgi:acetyl esterase/lipase